MIKLDEIEARVRARQTASFRKENTKQDALLLIRALRKAIEIYPSLKRVEPFKELLDERGETADERNQREMEEDADQPDPYGGI